MRYGFDLPPRSTNLPPDYRVVCSTPFGQWASKAGLITTRDEFGDIYGLDDEVTHPIIASILRRFTVISWLPGTVVGYGPSAGQSRDSTLPVHGGF